MPRSTYKVPGARLAAGMVLASGEPGGHYISTVMPCRVFRNYVDGPVFGIDWNRLVLRVSGLDGAAFDIIVEVEEFFDVYEKT